MKKLDPKTLQYIAHAFGRNFAGDEENPAESEVPNPSASDAATDQLLNQEEAKLNNPNPPSSLGAGEEMAQADAGIQTEFPEAKPIDEKAAPASDQTEKAPVQSTPPTYGEAIQEQKEAKTAGAKAEADLGAAEAKAINEGQAQVNALPTANDLLEDNKVRRQALFDAYQSKQLDPNRYYENMGTGQKIVAGIGLLLGGMNSVKVIDDAVNRDIDAQKNSQDQAMNLYKMNREEYGDDQAANLATKNQILTGIQAQLQAAAASAKGPIAAAAAQQGNALIDSEWAMNNQKMGLNATLNGQTQEGSTEAGWIQAHQAARVLDPQLAADAEKKYLPGVGTTQIDIDQKGRDEISLNREYASLLNDSIEFQKSLPANRFAWTPSQTTKAAALAQQFDELGTRAQGINRLNGEEIKLAEQAYHPGKFQYGNPLSALQTLQKATADRSRLLYQKYNIKPFADKKAEPPPSDQPLPQNAPQKRVFNGQLVTKDQYLKMVNQNNKSGVSVGSAE